VDNAGACAALVCVVDQWNDLTDQAADLMLTVLARPTGPLGLPDFKSLKYNRL
jgi:hypothetical protein